MEYVHIYLFACDKCKGPIPVARVCANSPCSELELVERVIAMACPCSTCQHKQHKYGSQAIHRFEPLEWPYRIGSSLHTEGTS